MTASPYIMLCYHIVFGDLHLHFNTIFTEGKHAKISLVEYQNGEIKMGYDGV